MYLLLTLQIEIYKIRCYAQIFDTTTKLLNKFCLVYWKDILYLIAFFEVKNIKRK